MLTASPYELAEIGWASYGGETPHPPGPHHLDLSPYVTPAFDAYGYPSNGSVEFTEMTDRFLAELEERATHGALWGIVGAFCIAIDFVMDANDAHPTYLRLMDAALTVLRDDGVAIESLPLSASRRWESVHGSDGSGPALWPRSLEDLVVPAAGAEPVVVDLRPGEWRPMSRDGLDSRTTFAYRQDDGRVVAIIDGVDDGDGRRKQWELGTEADTYPEFLRALGDRLVTQPVWTHPELIPHFPCRNRSRNEMRELASLLRGKSRPALAAG
jgi:hypothetical protein